MTVAIIVFTFFFFALSASSLENIAHRRLGIPLTQKNEMLEIT